VATGVSTVSGIQYATAALRRHSNLMSITIPNYSRKNRSASVRNTDRHHFGIMIDISSEC
jgi:hypothetical protein